MSEPVIQSIPLSQMELSPANVRRTSASKTAFAELKASIAAHGLLENLVARTIEPGPDGNVRYAVIAYLQLGAQVEDQAVSLIAFSVWSQNRDLALADLFSRIFIRRERATTAESEIKAVHEKLKKGSSTRVSVSQRAFFQEVCETSDAEIVQFFLGYKWRDVPSVRLIPKRHIGVWRQLPGELRRIASSFHVDREVPRVSAAYNKLKHGPQLVIQNPIDRARRFGLSPEVDAQLARLDSLDKPGVRLLFAGAKTQPSSSEENVGSIAPFLIDHEGAVKNFLQHHGPSGNSIQYTN